MNTRPNLIKFINNNIGSILFFFLFFILFRDFLYTYRMQIERFLPYYPYHEQIIFYLSGDKNFDVQAPMNLRFFGLLFQYALFKFVPCLELTRIDITIPYPEYTCAVYSSALMNYISLCGIMALTFSYCYKKLRLPLAESILSMFFCYVFIEHVEAFTLDRVSILYLSIIIYFLDNKKISIFLILLASTANEKVVFAITILFFVNLVIRKQKHYKIHFICSIISCFLVLSIFIIYSKFLGYGYWGENSPGGFYNTFLTDGYIRMLGMFKSPSGYSNGFFPLFFCIAPYLISIFLKIKKKFFSNYELLIPLGLSLFATGGGTEQIGRYAMYAIPLFAPVLSYVLLYTIKGFKIN